jgi:hypothetical protein
MPTPIKPAHYAQSPKTVARQYLDGEYEEMPVTEVAAMKRLLLPSLLNAIKRERERRILEEVCV